MARPSYSADALVTEVIDPHPDLAGVVVAKTRHLYRIGRCTAEVSDVGVGRSTSQTVAIESSHLDELVQLREQLNLTHRVNCSYPRMIQGLLGWIAS